MGSYLSIVNDTNEPWQCKVGPDESGLKIAGVTGLKMDMVKSLSDQLSRNGFQRIAAGQRHRWGKMTLSLWQQGTCVKSAVVNDKTLRVEILYMRPIFSGATMDSNNDHKIQWWINKWGTKKQEIISLNGMRLLMAEDQEDGHGAIPEAAAGDSNVVTSADKPYYLSPNGTNTYTN